MVSVQVERPTLSVVSHDPEAEAAAIDALFHGAGDDSQFVFVSTPLDIPWRTQMKAMNIPVSASTTIDTESISQPSSWDMGEPEPEQAEPADDESTPPQERLRIAEKEYCDAGLRVSHKKAELKAAKASLAEAEESLDSLRLEILGIESVDDEEEEQAVVPVNRFNAKKHRQQIVEKYRDEKDENWWRAVPSTEVFRGVKIRGLGPKKIEALCHECRTLGFLEDLRAGAGFTSLKSFGPAAADAAEQVILDWLSDNRDALIFAAVGGMGIDLAKAEHEAKATQSAPLLDPPAVATQSVPLPNLPHVPVPEYDDPDATEETEEPIEEDVEIEAEPDIQPSATTADDIDPNIGDVVGRLESLRVEFADDEFNICTTQSIWESGRGAFFVGEKPTDCTWMPGDSQDDWLLGWLYAESKQEG